MLDDHHIAALFSDRTTASTAMGLVREMTSELTASDLEQVALRSYYHPNGFKKIVLGRRRGRELRVHFWPVGFEDGDAHSHRWNFRSLILQGALEQDLYVESLSAGTELTKCRAISPTTADRPYRHEPLATVKLERVARWLATAGSSYELKFDRIHRVRVPASQQHPTITVVLTEPQVLPHSLMYTSRTIGDTEMVPVAPVMGLDIQTDLLAFPAVP